MSAEILGFDMCKAKKHFYYCPLSFSSTHEVNQIHLIRLFNSYSNIISSLLC